MPLISVLNCASFFCCKAVLYHLRNPTRISIHIAAPTVENKTTEFKENVSRFGKLPCIVHGDFKLAENIAIFRYLDREFGLGQHNWYPKERTVRARVDEYLEWQHANIRAQCAIYFLYVWIRPLQGLDLDPVKVERLRNNMIRCLDQFESEWLDGGRKQYLAGEELTYADLLAACELEQPKIAGFDPRVGRPHLAAWLERVRNSTNPHYDQAHQFVYKFTPKEIPTPAVD
ncbi:glutathione S-transferase theta-2-like isoform X2 [Topomyia yanbarensis]|uniref:glutathione S-transferase theta-2-like isoform X2 n=1 Tax=Topomyia yanbarensis TaxID=2498891 RepID=UPI00273CC82B|nr:glutathione S-transferase theta-2-like isoform X2 [Topomyia yanbarensis]